MVKVMTMALVAALLAGCVAAPRPCDPTGGRRPYAECDRDDPARRAGAQEAEDDEGDPDVDEDSAGPCGGNCGVGKGNGGGNGTGNEGNGKGPRR